MVERFHERFGLEIGAAEAQRRFVNRVENLIFDGLPGYAGKAQNKIMEATAHEFGERYNDLHSLLAGHTPARFTGGDFLRTLQAIEIIWREAPSARVWLRDSVRDLLNSSEVNLDIEWDTGVFRRVGAALLDEKLAQDVLDWLKRDGLEAVRRPYEKALRDLLFGERQPDRLFDAVTGAYESLEALAKRVTARDVDLSKNREQFVANLKTSAEYRTLLKNLLKDYIEYGCRFRHAASDSKPKPVASMPEVESFIYLTGIFLRLGLSR